VPPRAPWRCPWRPSAGARHVVGLHAAADAPDLEASGAPGFRDERVALQVVAQHHRPPGPLAQRPEQHEPVDVDRPRSRTTGACTAQARAARS